MTLTMLAHSLTHLIAFMSNCLAVLMYMVQICSVEPTSSRTSTSPATHESTHSPTRGMPTELQFDGYTAATEEPIKLSR